MIHTIVPRFIAEIFAEDDPDGILDGLSYALPDDRSLASFVFYDDVPAFDDLIAMLDRAAEVIARGR